MVDERSVQTGWVPRVGSYEEAVLSWHEQVEASFRQREAVATKTRVPKSDGRLSVSRTGTSYARRTWR
jgi:hypothetical protein